MRSSPPLHLLIKSDRPFPPNAIALSTPSPNRTRSPSPPNAIALSTPLPYRKRSPLSRQRDRPSPTTS
ncbi:MAG: hypothetical protein F6K30_29150 [Cyanothece sp. SIO2G6]|nr:hypothetical protein [Cyanothece sp. SIO2G6]